jgi:hypothetical protein
MILEGKVEKRKKNNNEGLFGIAYF